MIEMAVTNQIPTHFSVVSVLPNSQNCCEAVKEIVGMRFLSNEVPMFPLNECDRYDQCRCKYERWDDRRQHDRRDFDKGIANQFFFEEEKRSLPRGRR